MRYFLDCEFNGMVGELLSLALVGEGNFELYLAREAPYTGPIQPWVEENVLPIISTAGAVPQYRTHFARDIGVFLAHDTDPVIVADWPDDIAYFCRAVLLGPGKMIDVRSLRFEVHRVDAYPTSLPNAVQHNALWDARALRRKIMEG